MCLWVLQRTCLGQNGLIPQRHAETGFGVAVCYCLLCVWSMPLLNTWNIPASNPSPIYALSCDLSLCLARVCMSRRRCDLQPILSRHLSLPLIPLINRALCIRGSHTDTYAPVWIHISQCISPTNVRLLDQKKTTSVAWHLIKSIIDDLISLQLFPCGQQDPNSSM